MSLLRDALPEAALPRGVQIHVAYELNAYTAKPADTLHAYSALHQNIQDGFNEAGVEISATWQCDHHSGELLAQRL
jgi:small-conductance mechanosensitive channel